MLLILTVWALSLVMPVPGRTAAGELQAGFARADITPTESISMAGYAGVEHVSKGVHDSLYCRAVVLSDGETTVALVGDDIIGIDHDLYARITDRIAARTGIPADRIMLGSTHTHSGPVTGLDAATPAISRYTAVLADRIVDAVDRARQDLKPATIGAGSGMSTVGVNRRARLARGGIWLGVNPTGPVDREVGVLRIDRNMRPAALVINYGVHGTVMGARNNLITGDAVGYASKYAEAMLSLTIAPFFPGAAGNVNPIYHDGSFTGRIGEPMILGKMLAEAAVRAAERIQTIGQVRIQTDYRTITLPGKKTAHGSKWREDGHYPPFERGDDVDIHLQAVKVGDIVLTAVSGEVFAEIALQLKEQSPYKHTYMFANTNGVSGYIPTDAAYDEGGYEVQASRLMPGAEHAVLDNLLEMIRGF